MQFTPDCSSEALFSILPYVNDFPMTQAPPQFSLFQQQLQVPLLSQPVINNASNGTTFSVILKLPDNSDFWKGLEVVVDPRIREKCQCDNNIEHASLPLGSNQLFLSTDSNLVLVQHCDCTNGVLKFAKTKTRNGEWFTIPVKLQRMETVSKDKGGKFVFSLRNSFYDLIIPEICIYKRLSKKAREREPEERETLPYTLDGLAQRLAEYGGTELLGNYSLYLRDFFKNKRPGENLTSFDVELFRRFFGTNWLNCSVSLFWVYNREGFVGHDNQASERLAAQPDGTYLMRYSSNLFHDGWFVLEAKNQEPMRMRLSNISVFGEGLSVRFKSEEGEVLEFSSILRINQMTAPLPYNPPWKIAKYKRRFT